MKKSILALGATVALGGLGFAGTAQAIAVYGPVDGVSDATSLRLSPGGVGHMLYVPYYNAQEGTSTMFSVVNTDSTRGKAVKVRFRGAANSDDVLDFTLYLSPNDVWSANLSQGANGMGVLTTSDVSCTDPLKEGAAGTDTSYWADEGNGKFSAPLSDLRLDQNLSPEVRALNANEGYIEILNMADILPSSNKDSLYYAIKHQNGVAPCTPETLQAIRSLDGGIFNLNPNEEGIKDEYNGELAAPRGGLMGSWAVLNQSKLASVSGDMGAIVAVREEVSAGGARSIEVGPDGVTPVSATANLAFFPQLDVAINGAVDMLELTADPLLRDGTLEPLWFDLPDMSTPLAADNSTDQARNLSTAISRAAFYNEYAAGGIATTDWVVSQPTRRYFAAMDYADAHSQSANTVPTIVWNANMNDHAISTTDSAPSIVNNRYAGLTKIAGAYGSQACHLFGITTWDREEVEARVTVGGGFSPGVAVRDPMCGEVFTLSFNGQASFLNAKITNRNMNAVGAEGWGRMTPPTASNVRLPLVGYSAISMSNNSTGASFGWTLPHRWDN